MINELRWKMFKFAWKLNFTGRMIEKTRCSFATGWQYAGETYESNPHMLDAKPSEVADYQIRTQLCMDVYTSTGKKLSRWFEDAEHGEIACCGTFTEFRQPLGTTVKTAKKFQKSGNAMLFQKRRVDGAIDFLIRKVSTDETG